MSRNCAPKNGKMLKAALDYATRGLKIFPVTSYELAQKMRDSKQRKKPHPMLGRKGGYLLASDDPDQIKKWWAEDPGANIGLPMSHNGLVALDIDPRNGGDENWDEFLSKLSDDLPATWRVETGGGGEHYIFKVKEQPAWQKLKGIDLKYNGYTIAPPSIHPDTGKAYVWDVDQCPELEEPKTWPDFLSPVTKSTTTNDEAKDIEPCIAKPTKWRFLFTGPPPEIDWDEAMSRAIASAMNFFPDVVIESTAERMTRPGWTVEQTREQIRAKIKYKRQELGIEEPTFHEAETKTQNCADLMGRTFEEPKYIVPGYLCEGATLLSGGPKVGKSLLSLDWMVAVATGGLAMSEIECEEGDVLYLCLDDPNERRLQSRIKAMKIDKPLNRLSYLVNCPTAKAGGMEKIVEWIGAVEKPRLVVIDVLQNHRDSTSTKNSNAYREDYETVIPYQRLALKYGIAILILHHTRKAESEDQLDKTSGSNGLNAAADHCLVLSRDRASGLKSLYGRGREIDLETLFTFENSRAKLIGDANELKYNPTLSKIITFMREFPGEYHPKEIAAKLGLDNNTIGTYLRRGVADGYLVKKGRGSYGLHAFSSTIAA